MADPLSIGASVVGVIVPALHGMRLLLDDLEKIKDAPKAVKRLEADVRSVDRTNEGHVRPASKLQAQHQQHRRHSNLVSNPSASTKMKTNLTL